MKIAGVRPDGSLDADVESSDGWLRSVLEAARVIATEQSETVHLSFNNRLIAVSPNTNLTHIERIYNFGNIPHDQEIGPEPMPDVVPEAQCGTFELNISTRR